MRRGSIVVALMLLAACEQAQRPVQSDHGPGDPPSITRVTEEGPVKMTVTLTPAEPRLGDPLSLTLTVEAQPGVTIEMPAFGEALGRFAILDFAPRRHIDVAGITTVAQHYTLQAPMSGKQRIPPLRIEYLDARPDAAAADGNEYRELLSEALTVQIASVLPEGQIVDELRPARPPLPELESGILARFWPWLLASVAAVGGLGGALVAWQRRTAARKGLTAYDWAMRRLEKLERQGLPRAETADAWYVELSDIVRRYIEDQYGVRAPEQTTEEFLQEAQRSADLSSKHRALLSEFLERCDRVKFAAYNPDHNESREALALAHRFLGQRPIVAERQRQPQSAVRGHREHVDVTGIS